MTALRSLWDDDEVARPSGRAALGDKGAPSPPARSSVRGAPARVPHLPLLPQPDEPRAEYRPRHRHLFLNQLDGPDHDAAVDTADRAMVERDVTLYGETGVSTRDGWTKEDAA